MPMLQKMDRVLFGTDAQRQDYGWLLRRQSSVVFGLMMTTLATAACLVVAPVLPLLPAGLAIATGLGVIVASWNYADRLRGRIAEARAREKAARPCYLPMGVTGVTGGGFGVSLQQAFTQVRGNSNTLRVSIRPAPPRRPAA